jgi:hypothetical protein
VLQLHSLVPSLYTLNAATNGSQMKELISPAQSDVLMNLLAFVLLVGGALWGMRVLGKRGAVVGLVGPLLWILWQGHKWITRYDPQTGYFGLDKVWVLALEIVIFVTLGAALGWAWKKLTTEGTKSTEN